MRSALAYFVLTTALAIPVVVLGFALPDSNGLPKDLPVTDLVLAFLPALAAMILVQRRQGGAGVRALLRRAVDHRRIGRKVWYLPILLLTPLLTLLSYGIVRLTSGATDGMALPLLLLPVACALFLVLAAGEELGHTAYATDALQRRLGALPTAMIIGLIWHGWHIPSILMQGKGWIYIAITLPLSVATRVIWIWLYNNAGRSTFAVILAHTMANLGGTYLPQEYAVPLAVMVALAVSLLWGGRYLTRFRPSTRQGLETQAADGVR